MQSFRWQKIAEVPNKQSHDVTVLPPDTSKMQSSCWQKIAEALNDVGVEISVTREQLTTAEGTRLIHKLLAQHCRGPRAFRTEGSVLIMITPDCSGGFHDEARVIEIESHPLANVAAWVEQFTLRCSRNESVRFLLQDGSEISPQCSY